MKVTFYIVLFMLCFGAGDVIITDAGMQGRNIQAWEDDQIADALNGTRIVESYDPSVNPFYDIGAGIRYLWNIISTVILSFVDTIEAYGAPASIVAAVKVVYGMSVVGLVIEFISGREFMP